MSQSINVPSSDALTAVDMSGEAATARIALAWPLNVIVTFPVSPRIVEIFRRYPSSPPVSTGRRAAIFSRRARSRSRRAAEDDPPGDPSAEEPAVELFGASSSEGAKNAATQFIAPLCAWPSNASGFRSTFRPTDDAVCLDRPDPSDRSVSDPRASVAAVSASSSRSAWPRAKSRGRCGFCPMDADPSLPIQPHTETDASSAPTSKRLASGDRRAVSAPALWRSVNTVSPDLGCHRRT